MKITDMQISDPARMQNTIGKFTDQSAAQHDFSHVIESALQKTNMRIQEAENLSEQMAMGKEVDIAEVMTAITKADLSFRMAMQVRNKALSAYEEIMRMQV